MKKYCFKSTYNRKCSKLGSYPIYQLTVIKFLMIMSIYYIQLMFKQHAHTYSCNRANVGSWSQRGSSAPGAEIPPRRPPSGAPGRSAQAARSRCMQTQGADSRARTGGTWVPDTGRELRPVLDVGGSKCRVSGLFQSEVAWREETGCPHGDRRSGCPPDCRSWGLDSPGYSHLRAEHRFWSFLISPSLFESVKDTQKSPENKPTWSFAAAHLCRASQRRSRSQTHAFPLSCYKGSGRSTQLMSL